jgi:hypothetical protein
MPQAINNTPQKKNNGLTLSAGSYPTGNQSSVLNLNQKNNAFNLPQPTAQKNPILSQLSVAGGTASVLPKAQPQQKASPYADGVSQPADMNLVAQYQKQFGTTPAVQTTQPGTAAPMGTPAKMTTTTPQPQQNTQQSIFQSVVGSLANPQASKQTVQAQKAYEKAVQNLQQFNQSAIDTKKGIYDAPTSARVMQGRDAAVQQANAETRAALQDAVGQQQEAIGFGQTQQSLNQQAQSAAAGFSAPQVTGFGQTAFNPLSGNFGGGSQGLDPQSAAMKLANEVVSGRMTYDQAVSSLGYAGGAGQQFLNQALQGVPGGYNIPLGQATLQGQSQVLGNLPALESADVAAEGIKNKINSYLSANPQLNPSALAVGNTLQQWVQGKQLSDPKYQTLFNYLNEYTNTLAPILGVGGEPTNLKTEIAQSFINAAASGQSITEVLENMQSLSKGKLQDLRSGATGGGVQSNPNVGGNQNSGTGTGGLYGW